jgi:AMP-activated protein kinase-like protein
MNNGSDKFNPEVQRYIDGELPAEAVDSPGRAEADRLLKAAASFSGDLELPGAEIDRVVMASIRARPVKERESFLSWLFQPHAYQLRPAMAAAAVVVLVAAGVLGGSIGDRQPAEVAAAVASTTVLVRFELVAPTADRVTLAGSFNDWQSDGVQLARNMETGVWTGTVPLRPGEHQYMFVIDGVEWIPDPDAHAQVDDGFGQTNSVIVVGPRGVIRS